MSDLKIQKGYVIYPGDEAYSLGTGISTVPAAQILMSADHVAVILEMA